jgi:hypothetical protein
MTRGLAAYSCGGSPGFAPEFPFHPHRWGTCRAAALGHHGNLGNGQADHDDAVVTDLPLSLKVLHV